MARPTSSTGLGVDIEKVGVVGCGLMGSGIAEVAAKADFDVVVREVSGDLIEAGQDRIRKSLDRAVEREKLTGPTGMRRGVVSVFLPSSRNWLTEIS